MLEKLNQYDWVKLKDGRIGMITYIYGSKCRLEISTDQTVLDPFASYRPFYRTESLEDIFLSDLTLFKRK